MFALTASPLAFAAGGDCPATFDSDDCDIGGGVNACTAGTEAGVDFIRCDLGTAGASSTATIVRALNGTSRFSAWGTYGSTKFCCAYTDTAGGYADIKIQGSDFPDTLKYNYNNTYDLSAYNATTLYGSIDGGEGSDTIIGSNTNAASYVESLYGGAGATCMATGDDTINGGAGDDNIYGECGNDTLLGGPGVDVMSGGPDADTLLGGVGDDIMDGDEGNDVESGGDGDDTMDGGAGTAANNTDVLCGEGNTGAGDVLTASAGTSDKLWGAQAGDMLYCNGISTSYDGVSGISGCSGTVLTTRPTECP